MSIWLKIKNLFNFNKNNNSNICVVQNANQSDVVRCPNITINNDAESSIEEKISDNNDQKDNIDIPPQIQEEEPVKEEIKKERTKHMFFESDKEAIANILRPIVRSYNNELKSEYICAVNCLEKDLKVLKTYVTISTEDPCIIDIRFTQSEVYNKFIHNFVREYLFEDFYSNINKEISLNMGEFTEYEYEIKDGHIYITRYLIIQ